MAISEQRKEWLEEFFQLFKELGAMARDSDRISKKSYDFACDQRDRFEQWGMRMFLSDKQYAWLVSIRDDMGTVPETETRKQVRELDDDIPF